MALEDAQFMDKSGGVVEERNLRERNVQGKYLVNYGFQIYGNFYDPPQLPSFPSGGNGLGGGEPRGRKNSAELIIT